MHLGQISLCDSIAYNIKSDEDKKKILDELNKKYAVGIIQRHHETFSEERHVHIINTNPYMLSVRTNGNPYYMYLTRYNFVNQCILVDKKVQQGYFYPRMILVRLWFADELFDNTLFEGEMVKDKRGGWTFIINDMMVYRNVAQTDQNLVTRLNMVYTILANAHVSDELDICCLRVKRYFLCSEIDRVIKHFVPNLPYTCRGLYFKPFFLKFKDVLFNFDDSLIKKIVKTNYKDAGNFLLMSDKDEIITDEIKNDDTRDTSDGPFLSTNISSNADDRRSLLWVKHTNLPDVYELYENAADISRGASTSFDRVGCTVACVPNLKTSRALRGIFQNRGVTDAIRMECVFCEKFQKWTPVREVVASPQQTTT
jgi:hypothetical protein